MNFGVVWHVLFQNWQQVSVSFPAVDHKRKIPPAGLFKLADENLLLQHVVRSSKPKHNNKTNKTYTKT